MWMGSVASYPNPPPRALFSRSSWRGKPAPSGAAVLRGWWPDDGSKQNIAPDLVKPSRFSLYMVIKLAIMVVFFWSNCKHFSVGIVAWILFTNVLWFTCAAAHCHSSFSDIIYEVCIFFPWRFIYPDWPIERLFFFFAKPINDKRVSYLPDILKNILADQFTFLLPNAEIISLVEMF